ncbi:MAG TPA: hypothetical protein VGN22_20405 [Pseudonocardia sp.]
MSPAEQLVRLGGIARRPDLSCSRSELHRAVEAGVILRSSRGRYALPTADRAAATAHGAGGVMCLLSAALHHGWKVRLAPDRPQVSLPRNLRRPPAATGIEVHRLRLHPGDSDGIATTRDRTLVDCLRLLPPTDALAVVDSALREGYSPRTLHALVRDLRGPGSAGARRIAHLADARAANPFESALRAIALSVPGLAVVPQVDIFKAGEFLGRPDLIDERLRMVIEAESFEWHGGTAALTADARRFNALALDDWLVLRFTWIDVIHDPVAVRCVLEAAVLQRTNRCGCEERRLSVAPSAALVTIGPF